MRHLQEGGKFQILGRSSRKKKKWPHRTYPDWAVHCWTRRKKSHIQNWSEAKSRWPTIRLNAVVTWTENKERQVRSTTCGSYWGRQREHKRVGRGGYDLRGERGGETVVRRNQGDNDNSVTKSIIQVGSESYSGTRGGKEGKLYFDYDAINIPDRQAKKPCCEGLRGEGNRGND